MNSTANIHRRFSLLFILPSKFIAILLLFITSFLLYFIVRIATETEISLNLNLIIFFSSVFIAVIIETKIIRNPLAIFRRLTFISAASNLLLALIILLGILFIPEKIINYIIIGILLAWAFRILIFSSVFIKKMYKAILLAVFQPLLITLTLIISSYSLNNYIINKPIILGIGLIPVVGIILFLYNINSLGKNILNISSTHIFQAFLNAWSADHPEQLEKIISESSTKTQVQTNAIYFNNNRLNSIVVVPEVHPGPFHPIGSSNLPFRILQFFQEKSLKPMIFHGLSGHESNLPSKEEVESLLSSYNNLVSISKGKLCTEPLTYKIGKTTINGIAFGDCALLFITLSPNGMEDLPQVIKKPLEHESILNGFKNLIIVDTHNSQGNQSLQIDQIEIIKVGNQILKQLSESKQHPFRVGYGHSSDFNINVSDDIGPGGISVLVLEINNHKFGIVSVDSNNAIKNFREELISELKKSNITILEICTSDTHINAGKIMTSYGYIALGDITNKNYLAEIIKKIYAKAITNISYSNFNISKVNTSIKIVGNDFIKKISYSLDKIIRNIRKGAIYLILINLIILIFSAMI